MEGNTSCVPELTAGMSEASTRTAETAASHMPPLSPDKSAGGFFYAPGKYVHCSYSFTPLLTLLLETSFSLSLSLEMKVLYLTSSLQ